MLGVTPIALLCVLIFTNTFSIGAFPVLLPELGKSVGLSDWQLGIVAGAFGFARMVSDIPAGLFITHRLGRALLMGPLVLAVAVLCLGSGGPFAVLVLGRALIGVAHTLCMIAGLTAILRYHAPRTLSSALNAFEFAGMLGVLGGMVLVGALPVRLSWNTALVLTSTPQLVGLVVLPWILTSLPASNPVPATPLFARSATGLGVRPTAGLSPLVPLAFAAGGAIAIAWSATAQFIVPLRGSREFGLDRIGVAQLLIIPQLSDVLVLLPLGALSDRMRTTRVLGLSLLVLAAGTALVSFGTLPFVVVGCVVFGVGLAGWMLPLTVLRRETSPDRVAWWTALYRIGVDGGIFLGPFLSGFLDEESVGLLPGVIAGVLVVIGLLFLRRQN